MDTKTVRIKDIYEENTWTLRSYEEVRERTLKDLVIFRARSKELEDYANFYKQHLSSLNIQQLNLNQTRKHLNEMLEKARIVSLLLHVDS